MGIKAKIIAKAFLGHKNIFTNLIEKKLTGAPTNNSRIGTLCYNSADDDCYIATDAAGTWVKINS